MAPKRKRSVWQRPTFEESSFTDCPACQMKVVSHLMNHHLDWDCLALVRSKEQSVIFDAAETTNVDFKSPAGISGVHGSNAEGKDGQFFDSPDESFHYPCNRSPEKIPRYVSSYKSTAFKLNPHSCDEHCFKTHKRQPDVNPVLNSNSDSYYKKDGEQFCSVSFTSASSLKAELTDTMSECNLETNELSSCPCEVSLDSGSIQSSAGASTLSPKSSRKEGWKFITASLPPKVPKGHQVIENFISEKEEQELVSFLDTDIKNPWKVKTFNGIHVGKSYGLSPDLKQRRTGPAAFEMPEILVPMFERMRSTVPALRDFWPNETNAIEYCKHKGHWLKPHVDDRQLSGTTLVNLSLCGDCKMTYDRERGPRESYKVLLRRRSIQIQTGDCRYNFTHSILNEDLLTPRRVSMTFRQSVTN